MPPITRKTSLVKKLLTAVRNDPQKAAILVVLVSILGVLQVRLQMSDKGGPSKARASSSSASTAPAASKHPRPGAAGGSKHVAGAGAGAGAGAPMQPVAASSGRPADASSALRAWMDTPPKPIGRNLFAIDLERFPHSGGRVEANNEKLPTFWDELAKSMTLRADVRRERQVMIENLTRQASQLRLQSTMMGASPRAVINGEMVGERDVVAAGSGETRVEFRVLKIEARRIIVEREGIKLEIQMK